MSKMSMHIAFEAARLLESEAMMGLWEGDSIVDPDVNDQDQPYILIRVEEKIFKQVQNDVPDSVTVLNRDVAVIVKSLTMRMN